MRLDYVPRSISFEIEKDSTTFIAFENAVDFEEVVFDLRETILYGGDKVRLWDGGNIIDLHRSGDIITSPFEMNFDKREIQKKALELFSSELRYCGFDELLSDINQSLLKMISETEVMFDYTLEYPEVIAVNDVLKGMGVRLREPEGAFMERMIEYVRCLHRIAGKSKFFVVNCGVYLRENDNPVLGQLAKDEKVEIIQVDGITNKSCRVGNESNVVIIDNDSCELYI